MIITAFYVNSIDNFSVSETMFQELLKKEEYDFEQFDNEDNGVTFELSSSAIDGTINSAIYGTIKNGIFYISNLICRGPKGVYDMKKIYEPLFRASSGIFIASCRWYPGGTMNKVYVKNGDVEWFDIKECCDGLWVDYLLGGSPF